MVHKAMAMASPANRPPRGSSPEYVVGIDFGYTHTGVAFTCLESGEIFEPSVVYKWPGKLNEVINKVPTKVSYRPGYGRRTGWGFDIHQGRPRGRKLARGYTEEKYFKLNLDEEILKASYRKVQEDTNDDEDDEDPDDGYDPSEYEDVKKWFRDYLNGLYEWIRKTLEPSLAQKGATWETAIIEFIFSVPTTWNTNVVTEYEKIIAKAGYKDFKGHTARTGLTEAEAAAVYTAVYDSKGVTPADTKQGKLRKYKEGDVLIVCDAGGGTTDVSALQVSSFNNQVPQMDELGPVHGDSVGSVNIDEAFTDLVRSRLKQAHIKTKPFDRKAAMVEMTSGEFQQYKVHFGEKSIALLPSIKIRVPGLGESDNYPSANIVRGEMVFTMSEIEKLFDGRIECIANLIDSQLKNLQEDHFGTSVKFLILSGGLGSSEYLKQRLEERYIKQKTWTNAQGMKILVAKDPQLVVCRGLVLGRIQDSFKISVIAGRCCRAFYGITYDERYDKRKHSKKEREKNPNDGQYYVPGKIYWLIRKGTFVNDHEPPKKNFHKSLNYRDTDKWLNHRIVRFDGRKDVEPPDAVKAEGITTVCKVDCNLGPAIASQGTDLEHVRVQYRHRIFSQNLGGKFFEADYDIVVRIGPADLKFQLIFDGKERSRSEELRVDWKEWKRVYKVMATPGASETDSECSDDELSDDEVSAVDSGYSASTRTISRS